MYLGILGFFFAILFCFVDKVLLCSIGWPTSGRVDQSDLEVTEIDLLLLSDCWDPRRAPPYPVYVILEVEPRATD